MKKFNANIIGINKKIPEQELFFSFSRSGGPGGQNVNKVASKVTLKWAVGESSVLTTAQKAQLRVKLKNRINKNDELVVQVESERGQFANRRAATALLNQLVLAGIRPVKKRLSTRPTRGSVERRLKDKKSLARKKEARHQIDG